MDGNYNLSDLAAVTNGNGFGGNNGIWLILFALLFGNNGWNRNYDGYGQYATAASQQEILFGQQFQNLDNKLDRLGNGVADATFALNNTVVTNANNIAGTVIAEGRSISDKMCELKTVVHAEGEATRTMMQQNKIESLQAQVNELKTQNMFCGIPRINPYGYGVYAYQNSCGNACCAM